MCVFICRLCRNCAYFWLSLLRLVLQRLAFCSYAMKCKSLCDFCLFEDLQCRSCFIDEKFLAMQKALWWCGHCPGTACSYIATVAADSVTCWQKWNFVVYQYTTVLGKLSCIVDIISSFGSVVIARTNWKWYWLSTGAVSGISRTLHLWISMLLRQFLSILENTWCAWGMDITKCAFLQFFVAKSCKRCILKTRRALVAWTKTDLHD